MATTTHTCECGKVRGHEGTTMQSGMYKVSCVVNREKLNAFLATEGRSAAGTWYEKASRKSLERWLNNECERDDLFARWAKMGIAAKMGRYCGKGA